ncbi:MAG: CapA family protein [Bacillota bacterium]
MLRKFLFVVLVLLFSVFSCPKDRPGVPKKEVFPAPEPRQVSITIAAMGDFLMHLPVVYSVKDPLTGRFEFGKIFFPVKELIAGADYSIANLETRLAGAAAGYSGYPRFNCPADLAAEMHACGLDMFLTANNHSLDKGVEGVIATIRNLAAAGMDHVGTYASAEERAQPFLKDIKGVKVGILNYTSSTNGLPVPKDKPYLVNLIDRPVMLEEIKKMQQAGADVIIACLHFGTEYSRSPGKEQRDLVNFLFQSGVDIVLGNHPHVVQPVQFRTVTENGVPKKKFVVYSLGNFISNQRWRYSDSGLLVNLRITKNLDDGETFLEDVELIPVWVDTYRARGRYNYRVLPVDEAIKNYEEGSDPLLTAADYQRLKQVAEELGPDFLFLMEDALEIAKQ